MLSCVYFMYTEILFFCVVFDGQICMTQMVYICMHAHIHTHTHICICLCFLILNQILRLRKQKQTFPRPVFKVCGFLFNRCRVTFPLVPDILSFSLLIGRTIPFHCVISSSVFPIGLFRISTKLYSLWCSRINPTQHCNCI